MAGLAQSYEKINSSQIKTNKCTWERRNLPPFVLILIKKKKNWKVFTIYFFNWIFSWATSHICANDENLLVCTSIHLQIFLGFIAPPSRRYFPRSQSMRESNTSTLSPYMDLASNLFWSVETLIPPPPSRHLTAPPARPRLSQPFLIHSRPSRAGYERRLLKC
jgi:hypothetical protein